jgi:hypothetical protein
MALTHRMRSNCTLSHFVTGTTMSAAPCPHNILRYTLSRAIRYWREGVWGHPEHIAVSNEHIHVDGMGMSANQVRSPASGKGSRVARQPGDNHTDKQGTHDCYWGHKRGPQQHVSHNQLQGHIKCKLVWKHRLKHTHPKQCVIPTQPPAALYALHCLPVPDMVCPHHAVVPPALSSSSGSPPLPVALGQ